MIIRLYGKMGCPHCIMAEELLRRLVGNVLNTVTIDGDPVAIEGLKAITGIDTAPVPVLVIGAEPIDIVVGYKPEEYRRVLKAVKERELANVDKIFDSVLSALASSVAASNSKAAGAAEETPEPKQTPERVN